MIKAATLAQHYGWENITNFGEQTLINFPESSIIKPDEMGELFMETQQRGNNICSDPMSEEQVEKVFKKFLKLAKRIIKHKIPLYEPLQFKTTYTNFFSWFWNNRCKIIRDMPDNEKFDEYLNQIVKDFLIENAYYAMEEKHIRQRVMNKLGLLDHHNIRLLEIVDFIIDGIERNSMKRIKTFGEKCKFKTYFFTVVSSLLNDFWRHHYSVGKNVTRYEKDFEQLFPEKKQSTEKLLIEVEDQNAKERAAQILPLVLSRLAPEELVVIKLKYEKNISVSAIARMLGRTRFKTEQYIKQVEKKISMEVLNQINYPQRDDQIGSRR